MKRVLRTQAEWAKLRDLEELSLAKDQSETRICVGFDGAETPCLVLRSDGVQETAEMVSPRFFSRKDKTTVLPSLTKLNAPKSGWVAFDQYLKEQGITIPLRFVLDDKHIIDPDEGSIVIETKTGPDYGMIFFPLGTETEDGKRALGICRKVEQEFGISMRCGEGRS